MHERGDHPLVSGAAPLMLREGEDPTRVLVLTDGRAKAVTFTEDGKEVVLGFIGPGELIGEVGDDRGQAALGDGRSRVEPVTALALAAGDFWALLDEHPRLWVVVHRIVIQPSAAGRRPAQGVLGLEHAQPRLAPAGRARRPARPRGGTTA